MYRFVVHPTQRSPGLAHRGTPRHTATIRRQVNPAVRLRLWPAPLQSLFRLSARRGAYRRLAGPREVRRWRRGRRCWRDKPLSGQSRLRDREAPAKAPGQAGSGDESGGGRADQAGVGGVERRGGPSLLYPCPVSQCSRCSEAPPLPYWRHLAAFGAALKSRRGLRPRAARSAHRPPQVQVGSAPPRPTPPATHLTQLLQPWLHPAQPSIKPRSEMSSDHTVVSADGTLPAAPNNAMVELGVSCVFVLVEACHFSG